MSRSSEAARAAWRARRPDRWTPGALRGLVLATGLATACATMSVPQERQMGDELARQVQAGLPLVRDPWVVDYVQDIGQRLVRAAGPQPFAYRFYVVADPEVNAFAMPGGHVYVNTGTIQSARNASELAGVVAHEIGHVVHRHVAENLERQRWANIGRNAAVLGTAVLGGPAGAVGLAGDLTAIGVLNSFGRDAEREADAFAVETLPAAGYDPIGMLTFFQTLAQKDGGAAGASFLSSHPATQERIDETRRRIHSAQAGEGLRTDDGGRLEIIQRRIELLLGPPPKGQPEQPGGRH